jgi:glutathione S-transferase
MTTLPDAFTSTHDLTLKGEAATTPSSLRAFGYFGKIPMISQRVVNESAAVVDDLEKRFPKN